MSPRMSVISVGSSCHMTSRRLRMMHLNYTRTHVEFLWIKYISEDYNSFALLFYGTSLSLSPVKESEIEYINILIKEPIYINTLTCFACFLSSSVSSSSSFSDHTHPSVKTEPGYWGGVGWALRWSLLIKYITRSTEMVCSLSTLPSMIFSANGIDSTLNWTHTHTRMYVSWWVEQYVRSNLPSGNNTGHLPSVHHSHPCTVWAWACLH